MARRTTLAAVLAAATTALAACTAGAPSVTPLAGTFTNASQTPAPTPVTSAGATGSGHRGTTGTRKTTTTGTSVAPGQVPPGQVVPSQAPAGHVQDDPDLPGFHFPAIPGFNADLSVNTLGAVFHGGSLPAGFPTPPGTSAIGVINTNGDIVAQMTVSDPVAAYHFWLDNLSRNGYAINAQVIKLTNGKTKAGINFGGHGFQPTSAIEIINTVATVAFVGQGDGTTTTTTTGQPPAPKGTIEISDNGAHETRACAPGGSADIKGINNVITLTGDCGTINVLGTNNRITVDTATTVNFTGSDNTVTVHQGHPQVNTVGAGDEVHIG